MNTTMIPGRSRLIRFAMTLLAFLAIGVAHADSAREIDAREIDAHADAALSEFRRTVKGADEYLAAAKGVLMIPEVKKVGLVVGGQWGDGVLRVGGKTVDYYRLAAASVGFQAGVQQANYLFIFLTEEALGYSLKGQKLTRFKPE
ncbi:MAG: hypothetical protein OSW71_18150 [Proteobacteria bacterium]|nr:hypothetical protein [Pseudomonadota bacterium]